jgi:hypothetical protein
MYTIEISQQFETNTEAADALRRIASLLDAGHTSGAEPYWDAKEVDDEDDNGQISVELWADNEERYFAICKEGDEAFRASTIVNGIFTHVVDSKTIPDTDNWFRALYNWLVEWKHGAENV